MAYEEINLASGVTARLTAGSSASTAPVSTSNSRYRSGVAVFTITNAGTGGTSLQWIIQGSLDGTNWFDLASPDTCVPADNVATQYLCYLGDYSDVGAQAPAKGLAGTIAARVQRPGFIPNLLRILEVVVGTYSPGVTYSCKVGMSD